MSANLNLPMTLTADLIGTGDGVDILQKLDAIKEVHMELAKSRLNHGLNQRILVTCCFSLGSHFVDLPD